MSKEMRKLDWKLNWEPTQKRLLISAACQPWRQGQHTQGNGRKRDERAIWWIVNNPQQPKLRNLCLRSWLFEWIISLCVWRRRRERSSDTLSSVCRWSLLAVRCWLWPARKREKQLHNSYPLVVGLAVCHKQCIGLSLSQFEAHFLR